jgi:hypothetical protein
VYIDFDTPVAIRTLVDIESHRIKNAKDEFFAHRASMQKVATFIATRFFALYRLLPMHLVAAVLCKNGPMTAAEIAAAIPSLLEKLRSEGRNLSLLAGCSPAKMTELGTRQLERLRVIARRDDRFTVKKRTLLEYCAAPVNDRDPLTEEQKGD